MNCNRDENVKYLDFCWKY